MRKPKNRKERIEFLSRKMGRESADLFVYFTDKEVKQHFDGIYLKIKNRPDYETKASTCMRCGEEVIYHYECGCSTEYNRVVFDNDMWLDDLESNTDDRDLTAIAIEKNQEFKLANGLT